MKLNRDFINNHKLPDDKMNAFKELAKEQVKAVDIPPFKKFFIGWINILISILLIVIGAVVLFLGFSRGSSGILSVISIILIAFGVIDLIMLLAARKKILKNFLKDFNWDTIITHWFNQYGVEASQATYGGANPTGSDALYINSKRLSPSDANIFKYGGNITITIDGIDTTFHNVTWRWTRRYKTKNGTVTKTFYLDQAYIMQRGFDKKWDSFKFTLARKSQIIKRKKESLENTMFNKAFSYDYNNPILLRRLFTVYTQEFLLNNWKNNRINIYKESDAMITTCKNKDISYNFTPFILNVSSSSLNIDAIKENVARDISTDFIGLMNMLSYPLMLESIFKKMFNNKEK